MRSVFSRRQLLQWGAVAAGSAILPVRRAQANIYDYASNPFSPPTRPFVAPLYVPVAKQPVLRLSPTPDTTQFQRYREFPAQKLYEFVAQARFHAFHPDLQPSYVWKYDSTPVPQIDAFYGEPIIVRFWNDLPADHVGFGSPEIITHLHNAHTASESDGFAEDFFGPGYYKDHHYANFYAGGDSREALGSLWFHDHRADFTAPNVYRGLRGVYNLYDDLDTGNETTGLRLPSGLYDIPLMFSDPAFTKDSQLYLDPFDFDGFLGDKYAVNETIQPYLRVARRKYRFRLYTPGPSRHYVFELSNGEPMTQIASDGNLLAAPLIRENVNIGPAERVDVVIDFSQYPDGTRIELRNILVQVDPRKADGISRPGVPVMRFDVVGGKVTDPSRVPATLRPQPPIDLNRVAVRRTWEFGRNNGQWAINGQLYDGGVVRAAPRQGTAEIWTLKNGGGGWAHPIHMHFEEFRILTRNGTTPPPHERGRKDVIVLGPGEEAEVYLKFRDFTGRYLMHCHNSVHEDHAMMLRWDIVR